MSILLEVREIWNDNRYGDFPGQLCSVGEDRGADDRRGTGSNASNSAVIAHGNRLVRGAPGELSGGDAVVQVRRGSGDLLACAFFHRQFGRLKDDVRLQPGFLFRFDLGGRLGQFFVRSRRQVNIQHIGQGADSAENKREAKNQRKQTFHEKTSFYVVRSVDLPLLYIFIRTVSIGNLFYALIFRNSSIGTGREK